MKITKNGVVVGFLLVVTVGVFAFFGWSLHRLVKVYEQAMETPTTPVELPRRWGFDPAVFNAYFEQQIEKVNTHSNSVNLTLALIAIVITVVGVIVTALSIGLSISLTIKDGDLRKDIEKAEEKVKKSDGQLDTMTVALIQADLIEDDAPLLEEKNELKKEAEAFKNKKEYTKAFRHYKKVSEIISNKDKLSDKEEKELQEIYFRCGKSAHLLWWRTRTDQRFKDAEEYYEKARTLGNTTGYHYLHSTIGLAYLHQWRYSEEGYPAKLQEAVKMVRDFCAYIHTDKFIEYTDKKEFEVGALEWAITRVIRIMAQAHRMGVLTTNNNKWVLYDNDAEKVRTVSRDSVVFLAENGKKDLLKEFKALDAEIERINFRTVVDKLVAADLLEEKVTLPDEINDLEAEAERYWKDGKYPAVIQCYEKAIGVVNNGDPESIDESQLQLFYYKCGRAAHEQWWKNRQLNRLDEAKTYYIKAITSNAKYDLNTAQDEIIKAIPENPSLAAIDALIRLAYIYRWQGLESGKPSWLTEAVAYAWQFTRLLSAQLNDELKACFKLKMSVVDIDWEKGIEALVVILKTAHQSGEITNAYKTEFAGKHAWMVQMIDSFNKADTQKKELYKAYLHQVLTD